MYTKRSYYFLIIVALYTIMMVLWVTIGVLKKPQLELTKNLKLNEIKKAKIPTKAQVTCSSPYSNCDIGKPGHINVHIVSHTHNDVGWVKSLNEYFYGNDDDKKYNVREILGILQKHVYIFI